MFTFHVQQPVHVQPTVAVDPKNWTTWPKYSDVKEVEVLVFTNDKTVYNEPKMSIKEFKTHQQALKALLGDGISITPEMSCVPANLQTRTIATSKPAYVIELTNSATTADKTKFDNYFEKMKNPNKVYRYDEEQIMQTIINGYNAISTIFGRAQEQQDW